MDPVVHFEMPYDDPRRMADFYAAAFGWQTRMLGADMDSYVLATTTETGDAGPARPGAINGGFFAREHEGPPQHPSLVIAVQDITESMNKVKSAGGKILSGPTEIPGVGQYVAFADTEGNRVSMLEAIPEN